MFKSQRIAIVKFMMCGEGGDNHGDGDGGGDGGGGDSPCKGDSFKNCSSDIVKCLLCG